MSILFYISWLRFQWGLGREGSKLTCSVHHLKFKVPLEAFRQGSDMDNSIFLKGPRGCTAENGLRRARMGIKIVLNDWGSNFLSENIQCLRLLGVRHFTKIAHRSKSNKLVECFHGALEIRTETRRSRNPDDWDRTEGTIPAPSIGSTSGAYLRVFLWTGIWGKQKDFLFW